MICNYIRKTNEEYLTYLDVNNRQIGCLYGSKDFPALGGTMTLFSANINHVNLAWLEEVLILAIQLGINNYTLF